MIQRALTVLAVVAFVLIAYLLLRSEFAPLPEPAAPLPSAEPPRPAMPTSPKPAVAPVFEPEPEVAAIPDVAEPDPEEEPAVVLPGLDESDDYLRTRLEGFALPDAWLTRTDLVRRFCVVVDNATRGEWVPRGWRFLAPKGPFRVIERDGRVFGDPRNGTRFDMHLDVLESVDPVQLAALISELEPLLDEGMAALGSPETARSALTEAVARILEAPEPLDGAELVRPKVLYVYADPALETLPPLEKQLLRLGRSNLDRLKAWLARFEAAWAETPGKRSTPGG